ncbi:DUF4232 domain-containing protein [Streptomyces sp. INA 01156]
MSTRTHRTRVFAAAAFAAAALTLTACSNGEGVYDEGAAAGSASTSAPTSSPEASGEPSPGWGRPNRRAGSPETRRAARPVRAAPRVPRARRVPRAPAPGVRLDPLLQHLHPDDRHGGLRPLNHLLLTVTNTGSKNCDLIGYPAVRFGEAQSVPPAFEDSKPQAVVTLAPGESGYAGVLLSAADGSGSHGYTTKSLQVFFNDGAGTARRHSPRRACTWTTRSESRTGSRPWPTPWPGEAPAH